MGSGSTKIGDYDINFSKKLGEGGFGKVFKGSHRKTKGVVAIKKCEAKGTLEMTVIMKEIQALCHVPEHDNIIEFYGFHFHDDSAWIIMEYCELGDLHSYYKSHNPGVDGTIGIMVQCLNGLIHMHSLKDPIVHRDLKPENILFRKDGGKHIAKICDFGLAKVLKNSTILKTIAGTALYMAPELLLEEPYDYKVDVFSMGLVFLSMVLYEVIGELIPMSATAIKGGTIKPVATEMCQCMIQHLPQPMIAVSSDSDPPKMRMVKKIINAMVTFHPEERIKLTKVRAEMQGLLTMAPTAEGTLDRRPSLSSTNDGAKAAEDLLKKMVEQATEQQKQAKSKGTPVMPVNVMEQLVATLDIGGGLNPVESKDQTFRIGERVILNSDPKKIKMLQRGHGGWMKEMELVNYSGKDGWVIDIESKHIVIIKFDDGYRFPFNIELLKKHEGPPIPLGINSVKFKVGDMVRVTDDASVLIAEQKKIKFESRMVLATGMGGMVHKVLHKGLVVVECFNGDVWTFQPELIKERKVSDTHIEVGDFVTVTQDREHMVSSMKDNHLKWSSGLDQYLGSLGFVTQMVTPATAKVKVRGSTNIFPLSTLTLLGKKGEIDQAISMKSKMEGLVRSISKN